MDRLVVAYYPAHHPHICQHVSMCQCVLACVERREREVEQVDEEVRVAGEEKERRWDGV